MSVELDTLLQAANNRIASFPNLPPLSTKILQALIEFAPGNPQRINICREIRDCQDSEALNTLANLYNVMLIQKMRTAGNKTPKVSDHPSRFSFDAAADIASESALTPHRQQGLLRNKILARDNRRCLITGQSDDPYTNNPMGFSDLEAAHIIPFSIGTIGDSTPERDGVGQVQATIQQYGGIFQEELNGNRINREGNVMTLCQDVHTQFGAMRIWLEPLNSPDTYRLRKALPGYITRVPEYTVIRFTTQTNVPLPDRRYLALHAACAQVLHATGLGRVIEKLMQDYEDLTVLSSDGSSAELLLHALNMVSAC